MIESAFLVAYPSEGNAEHSLVPGTSFEFTLVAEASLSPISVVSAALPES